MAQKYEIPRNKPIYKGHQYDSDLEVNWAVFFDNAGIKFTPHPGTFRTGKFYSGKEIGYSPDFYLCDSKLFCEVKPDDDKLLNCEIQRKISGAMDENFSSISNGLLILGQMKGFSRHESKKLSLKGDFFQWRRNTIVRSSWKIRKADSGETKTIITFLEPDWHNEFNFSSYPYLPRDSSTKLYGDFDDPYASEAIYKALFEAIYAKQNKLFSYDTLSPVGTSGSDFAKPISDFPDVPDNISQPWD